MSLQSKVILLTGYKRSGKDATYDAIYKLLSKSLVVERIALADPMKEILADTLAISREKVDILKEETGREVIRAESSSGFLHPLNMRQLLQRFGQAMKEHTHEYFWVSLGVKKAINTGADIIVYTDMRFPFEVEEIKSMFDTVVIKIDRGLDQTDNHESEIYIDDIVVDDVVNNFGDLKDLENEVERILLKHKILQ